MKKNITEVENKNRQGISRRNFLSNTAMAGAGLILTPLLLSACNEQPKIITMKAIASSIKKIIK